MSYSYKKTRFTPKKAIRSFRDLEVYQKALECSVIIASDIVPRAERLSWKYADKLLEIALSVPLLIAEAHSLRFADFALALGYIEKAMSSCNKTVVYLDQLKGLFGTKANPELIEDVATSYAAVRIKMFRLERAWRKYMDKSSENPPLEDRTTK